MTYAANLPTANVSIAPGLESPTTDEFTVSLGYELPRGGYVKATYIDRSVSSFIENFTTLAEGFTDVPLVGQVDNVVFRNTDALSRDYQAIQIASRYRITNNWAVEGNYTYQLKNEGNFEGQDTNQPGISSVFGDYPEVLPVERFAPVGNLEGYQEHKFRLWTSYNFDFGRAGNLTAGVLFSFDSGAAYSIADENFDLALLGPAGRFAARNVGYKNEPGTRTLFFGERGTENFDDVSTVDLAVTYAIPVWKSVEPWVKLELRNIFDTVEAIDGQTSVRANVNGPKDQFGLPTTYTEGNFGQPTDAVNHFNTPQEFRASIGVRF